MNSTAAQGKNALRAWADECVRPYTNLFTS